MPMLRALLKFNLASSKALACQAGFRVEAHAVHMLEAIPSSI